MNKPVGKIKVNVYLTKIQYNQLCRYMEFCECYSTPAEMAALARLRSTKDILST